MMHKLDTGGLELHYTLSLEPSKPIEQPTKLKVTFQNPEDKSKPLVATQEVAAGAISIKIESPPIWGLRPRNAYEVVVRAYDSAGTLLGTHRQLIQSMIDTRRLERGKAQVDVPERWNFTFDSRQWQLGSQSADREGAVREYVLNGQTVENWSELVTSLYLAGNVAPRALFEQFRRDLSRGCPSLRVSIIEESAENIIFEWQHEGCQGFPAQHEIRRIARGQTGTLTLSFVEKTRQLTPDKRAIWISIIKAASVKPGA